MDDAYVFFDEIDVQTPSNPRTTFEPKTSPTFSPTPSQSQTFASSSSVSSTPSPSLLPVTASKTLNNREILDDAYTFSPLNSATSHSSSSSSSSFSYQFAVTSLKSIVDDYITGNSPLVILILVIGIIFLIVRKWWLQWQSCKKAEKDLSLMNFESMENTPDRGVAILESLMNSNQALCASDKVYAKFVKEQCLSRVNSLQVKLRQLRSEVEKLKDDNIVDTDKINTINETNVSGVLFSAKKDEQACKTLVQSCRDSALKLIHREVKELTDLCLYTTHAVDSVMIDLSSIVEKQEVDKEETIEEESLFLSKLQRCVQLAKLEEHTSLSLLFQSLIDDMTWVKVYVNDLEKISSEFDAATKSMLSTNVEDWRTGQNQVELLINVEVDVRFSRFEGLRKKVDTKIKEYKAKEAALVQRAYYSIIKRRNKNLLPLTERAEKSIKEAQGFTRERVTYQLKSSIWRWKKVEELNAMYSLLQVPVVDRERTVPLQSIASISSSATLILDKCSSDSNTEQNDDISSNRDQLISLSPRKGRGGGAGAGAGSMIMASTILSSSSQRMSFQDQETALSTWLSSSVSSSVFTDDSIGYAQRALTIVKEIQEREHDDDKHSAILAADRQNAIQLSEQIDSSGTSTVNAVNAMGNQLVHLGNSLQALQLENRKAAAEDKVRLETEVAMYEATKELQNRRDIAINNINGSWVSLRQGLLWMVSMFFVAVALYMLVDIMKSYMTMFSCFSIDSLPISTSSSKSRQGGGHGGYKFFVKFPDSFLALEGLFGFFRSVSCTLTVLRNVLLYLFVAFLAGNQLALLFALAVELYKVNVVSILLTGAPSSIAFAMLVFIAWYILVRGPANESLEKTKGEHEKAFCEQYSKKLLQDKRHLLRRLANNDDLGEGQREEVKEDKSLNASAGIKTEPPQRKTLFFILCLLFGIVNAVVGIGADKLQSKLTSLFLT